jgi:NAD(P)H-dependent flavin oxidoreductase YrpB (nitropropane dioxygenase family)
MDLPQIIQAGMGVAVSNWRLANTVGRLGQMGVVSGTGIDNVLIRRLNDGDPGGHLRRALAAFPFPEVAENILRRFFRPEGRRPEQPYSRAVLPSVAPQRRSLELIVAANFVEVWLAKEGHARPVGINYLEKLQLPHLPSLYGAMLAGVDVVLMGAGIPREIPAALDRLSRHEAAEYPLEVVEPGGEAGVHRYRFDPRDLFAVPEAPLRRPWFLAIIASNVLGQALAKRTQPPVDGFVVEAPCAGGHNAPPRGPGTRNARGEPVYGPRDEVDLAALARLGLPFWLAGGQGGPESLRSALAAGARGIQVGTPFALCEESGLSPERKRAVLDAAADGTLDVFTDPLASPTGFPFKVARVPGTLSDPEVYAERERVCDLGYLRQIVRLPEGGFAYRCPAEPVKAYVEKGGRAEDTVGRKCLCNALLADIGLAQVQKHGGVEPALVTLGDDARGITRFLREGRTSFTAADVVNLLLGRDGGG